VTAAGLAVVIVCGVLVANQFVVGPDVALFHRINHWPGWLYPPMWVVQLSGVIGALPLLAAAAALLRRFRLAAALAAAMLLKVSLEAVAKTFVQRGRPAETVPDVILRGNSAAHGLSFPSGHAMVIFAIAALVTPYLKGWLKVLPWALAAAVCLSRAYLGAHFPLDVVAGAGLGILIGSVLNLILGVPDISPSTPRANGFQRLQPLSTPRGGRGTTSTRAPHDPAVPAETHPLPLSRRATDHGGQAAKTTFLPPATTH